MKYVMVFGDSNTWGWVPDNQILEVYRRYSDDVRWTGILQNELGGGYQVITEGLYGRTTVWDDPIEEGRCGKDQIIPLLDTHAPLDLVIVMLGTNDLKERFTATAQDIAFGVSLIIDKILRQTISFGCNGPKVLLIAPPPLGNIERGIYKEMFGKKREVSIRLAGFFQEIARSRDISFFDAASVTVASDIDGVHLDQDNHRKLGLSVAAETRKILQYS